MAGADQDASAERAAVHSQEMGRTIVGPRLAEVSTTPEAIAKMVTDRDPSPGGMPGLGAITLRLALPRAVLERLRSRSRRHAQHGNLAEPSRVALVQAVLEREKG